MLKSSYKKKNQQELITLAQNDDYKALEELIKSVQKNVYTTLEYLVANKSNISDLTQNVLIKMSKGIKTLKEPEKFNTWLNRIISNVYFDEMRKLKNKCLYISIDDEECREIMDEKNIPPPDKCAASELDKIVKKSILNLPEHFKIAIILREFGGLSYQEIAEITHAGIGTVKSRIARARAKLQTELKHCI